MTESELKSTLETLLKKLEALPEFEFEPCCRLQNIFAEFKQYKADYFEHHFPKASGFDNQIVEIEENIAGLTSDDKGRDLEVYKVNIYHKSIKDLVVFIKEYLDFLDEK